MGGGKGESIGIDPELGPLLAQRNLGARPVCMGQQPADQPFTDQLSLEVCMQEPHTRSQASLENPKKADNQGTTGG